MRLKLFISSIIIAMTIGLPVFSLAQNNDRQWIELKGINTGFKAVSSQPDVEVFSAPNTVLLRVNHDVDVRIFTILGKLVSEQHLEKGIFQYKLDSHGIYIIKTDESSCKIAI